MKQAIKEYWDNWISKWYETCVLQKNEYTTIMNWDIPTKKMGNSKSACNYFPEPFWGNINAKQLRGVFLNINPGGGGDEQLFDKNSDRDLESDLKELVKSSPFKYSDVVANLSKNNQYGTTKWMFNKRIEWINQLYEPKFQVDIEGYLFFDLVPWHTPSKQNILNYCIKHSAVIFDNVLKPISTLANEINIKELKNKVIVRGSVIHDLFNNEEFKSQVTITGRFVILDSSEPFQKFSSLLTTFQINDPDYNKTIFYVFSGGASMMLPNPDYKIYDLMNNSSSILREVILKEI